MKKKITGLVVAEGHLKSTEQNCIQERLLWSDMQGICYYELLYDNQTLTDKSCYQELLPKVAANGYYRRILRKDDVKSCY